MASGVLAYLHADDEPLDKAIFGLGRKNSGDQLARNRERLQTAAHRVHYEMQHQGMMPTEEAPESQVAVVQRALGYLDRNRDSHHNLDRNYNPNNNNHHTAMALNIAQRQKDLAPHSYSDSDPNVTAPAAPDDEGPEPPILSLRPRRAAAPREEEEWARPGPTGHTAFVGQPAAAPTPAPAVASATPQPNRETRLTRQNSRLLRPTLQPTPRLGFKTPVTTPAPEPEPMAPIAQAVAAAPPVNATAQAVANARPVGRARKPKATPPPTADPATDPAARNIAGQPVRNAAGGNRRPARPDVLPTPAAFTPAGAATPRPTEPSQSALASRAAVDTLQSARLGFNTGSRPAPGSRRTADAATRAAANPVTPQMSTVEFEHGNPDLGTAAMRGVGRAERTAPTAAPEFTAPALHLPRTHITENSDAAGLLAANGLPGAAATSDTGMAAIAAHQQRTGAANLQHSDDALQSAREASGQRTGPNPDTPLYTSGQRRLTPNPEAMPQRGTRMSTERLQAFADMATQQTGATHTPAMVQEAVNTHMANHPDSVMGDAELRGHLDRHAAATRNDPGYKHRGRTADEMGANLRLGKVLHHPAFLGTLKQTRLAHEARASQIDLADDDFSHHNWGEAAGGGGEAAPSHFAGAMEEHKPLLHAYAEHHAGVQGVDAEAVKTEMSRHMAANAQHPNFIEPGSLHHEFMGHSLNTMSADPDNEDMTAKELRPMAVANTLAHLAAVKVKMGQAGTAIPAAKEPTPISSARLTQSPRGPHFEPGYDPDLIDDANNLPKHPTPVSAPPLGAVAEQPGSAAAAPPAGLTGHIARMVNHAPMASTDRFRIDSEKPGSGLHPLIQEGAERATNSFPDIPHEHLMDAAHHLWTHNQTTHGDHLDPTSTRERDSGGDLGFSGTAKATGMFLVHQAAGVLREHGIGKQPDTAPTSSTAGPAAAPAAAPAAGGRTFMAHPDFVQHYNTMAAKFPHQGHEAITKMATHLFSKMPGNAGASPLVHPSAPDVPHAGEAADFAAAGSPWDKVKNLKVKEVSP